MDTAKTLRDARLRAELTLRELASLAGSDRDSFETDIELEIDVAARMPGMVNVQRPVAASKCAEGSSTNQWRASA